MFITPGSRVGSKRFARQNPNSSAAAGGTGTRSFTYGYGYDASVASLGGPGFVVFNANPRGVLALGNFYSVGLVGPDGQNCGFVASGNGILQNQFFAYRGTTDAPSHMTSGGVTGQFRYRPYNGSGAFAQSSDAEFNCIATEDHVDNAHTGQAFQWLGSLTGTATRVTFATLGGAGGLNVGPTTQAPGQGNIAAENFFSSGGFSRVSTQLDVANSTTLANIPGLTATLAAGKTYQFEALLHCTVGTTGGLKVAMGGTCTATAIVYEIEAVSNSSNSLAISSRQTALGGSAGAAADTSYAVWVTGMITVNAAGTLTVQFAQNASNATNSNVLVGSQLKIFQVT